MVYWSILLQHKRKPVGYRRGYYGLSKFSEDNDEEMTGILMSFIMLI